MWKPLVALSVSALLLCSCTTTVVPPKVAAQGVRFDGNTRDAGFKGYTTNGFGVLSSNAVMRYDALAAEYGKAFKPPVVPGQGVTCCFTNGTWLITKAALVNYGLMADMERAKQK